MDEGRARPLGSADERGVEDVARNDAGIVVAAPARLQDEWPRLRRDDNRATEGRVGRERVGIHAERAGERDAAAADQVAARLRARERLPVDQRDAQPGPRQGDRRRAAARPRADHRDIVLILLPECAPVRIGSAGFPACVPDAG